MSKSITEVADQLEVEFDRMIVDGSDDELFASGYLRGHIDLVAAQLLMAGEQDVDKFWDEVDQSLQSNAKELAEHDWELVKKLLNRIRKTVEHPALK
ncbi:MULTISPECIES: YfcL family protein [Gammaproteobacteria]|uniref:YfcL family protein n=1 Tax=Gammaproteobacteria TaxID=1236 RepID=UPI000DD0E2F4|nr:MULTISPECIES: YfcL family protein [Gammaproteobacteria]RTE86857.1 YfcL family protein [Aliidiomarina sp. B3213]TCZ93354.1 YfcL family protein [Lysobacter sp. N42]